jgi:NAD(P)-dependent dehydrogenase (short-subunit alcohol dehydrogenase family)
MTMLGDKKILVTGAASGMGREIAIEAARQGATKIGVTDVNAAELSATAEMVRAAGAEVFETVADLLDGVDVRRMVESYAAWAGGLDTLVNNAGIMENSFADASVINVEDLSEDVWDKVIGVNLKAVWLATKYAAPFLKASQNGPSVINAASVAGMVGYEAPAYCASKAAVIQLTRTTAINLAPTVRANAYAPGSIKTPMSDKHLLDGDDPEAREREMSGAHLIPRRGEVGEIAESVCFLASDAASFITGVTLPVDGGTTAWRGLRD